MINKLIIIAGGLGVIYVVISTGYYLFQKNLIHIPRTEFINTPADHGLKFESVNLTNISDTAQIHGWFVASPTPSPTILFFSGNAGNMSYHLETVKILYEYGYSICTYDYRGYGKSSGVLSEDAQYSDAELVWNYLTNTRNIPAEQIILFGRSLGAGMASWVASRHKPGALVMESAFTSLDDIGKLYFKWLPIKFILKWHYDNRARISSVNSPTLFIHSKNDELIPYEHGQELYALANEPKQFLTIEGDHLEGYFESIDVYINGINDFVEQHLGDHTSKL